MTNKKNPWGRQTETDIVVQFHDCDPMAIVWHGHYVKYLEVARCELLASFGYNYDDMYASGYAWPLIDMQLRYVQAARFGQRIKVQATLLEWEYRLKIAYVITDAETGERITKAETTQVAIDAETNEMLLGSPPILAEKLGLTLSE